MKPSSCSSDLPDWVTPDWQLFAVFGLRASRLHSSKLLLAALVQLQLPELHSLAVYRTWQEHQIGSRRVTGGQKPFKQKNSGFIPSNAISVARTHTGIHGNRRSWCSCRAAGFPAKCSETLHCCDEDSRTRSRRGGLSLRFEPARRPKKPGLAARRPGGENQPLVLSTSRVVMTFMAASSSSV